MRRRELIAALGITLALPRAALAQSSGPVRRIAMLVAQGSDDDPEYEGRIAAFAEAMRGIGWVDGRNLKLSVYRAQPSTAEIRKRYIAALQAADYGYVLETGDVVLEGTSAELMADQRVIETYLGAG